MFEKRDERLLPVRKFVWRVVRYSAASGLLIVSALGLGVAGYYWIADLSFIDAVLNASMILTGMGPVNEMHTTAAKLFASAYALFSGIVFVSAAAVLFTPLFHRILHVFHVDESSKE